MKTPLWEASSGALMALLFPAAHVDRAFAYWDLYTFTTASGPVLRYAASPFDIAYGGNTWSSKQVRIDTEQAKANAHWKVGLDVDTWQAVFFPRLVDDETGATYPDVIGSIAWSAAVVGGALDAAVATVDRAYFPSPAISTGEGPFLLADGGGETILADGGGAIQADIGVVAWRAGAQTPTGVLRIFAGRVAEVDLGRSSAVISINSHLELLNISMPRNLWQAPCRHRLFDSGCTLIASSYAASGTCAAGSTRYVLVDSGLGAPSGSGTYTLGRVVMTSGNNSGFSRAVRSWDGTNWTLIAPLPFTVGAGDTFTAYPGCNKQFTTCEAFQGSNAFLNFGGAPYIPAPEAAA